MTQGSGLTLSLDNPVFASYIFYTAVLVAKTVFMSFWTARHRLPNKALPAPEDYKGAKDAEAKARAFCEPVERVRRAHLNDLENIPMFIFIGFCYVFIRPDPFTALCHFRVFTVARFIHTIGYLNAVTAIRGPGFLIGTVTMVSVIGQVIFYTFTAGFY